MDLYLPVANLSVNALVIILLGGGVGFLSGMFGVGGGFLTTPLRLGALAAGAVQPGAARVDVGPRLTLRLPQVGEGGRIALDWRQRIAGDARPESGLALTLAADF